MARIKFFEIRDRIKPVPLEKNGTITGGEVQKMFDVSRDTANRYLKKLLSSKLIERHGEGRTTYYVLG